MHDGLSTQLAGTQAIPNKAPRPRPSMKDTAYRALKAKLLTNVLGANALIHDAGEAEALGMSKTPVREALLLLEAEGLVEVLPRRGIRVTAISLQDMDEIYQLLTALEVTAVDLLAARTPRAEDLAPLGEACTAMRTALARSDTLGWNEADEAFHRGLLTLSGNRHLAQTGLRFRDRVQRAHLIAMRLCTLADLTTSVTQHEALHACLLSDRRAHAAQHHRDQRARGGARALAVLRASGLTQF